MSQDDDLYAQVRQVISDNRRTEWFLLGGIGLLFGLGIASGVMMLLNGQYVWSIPAVGSSVFLQWPIKRVERMRKRNIALAAAPIFISQLPAGKAAMEIQKVMQELFKEDS